MSVRKLALVASRLETNGVVLSKSRFALRKRFSRPPTPTALRHSAQGCEERATLGQPDYFFLPQRGCVNRRREGGCNPVGVVSVLGVLPSVATRRRNAGLNDGIPLGFSGPKFFTEARDD